ncbi:GntR family transcriptional regulator [Paracoccus sp. Z330]|uniref:GntR family transcriptional regulator n=1 Tax=Paracoccus onchidii TaxID=3017813 RepID=A0ABT4ZDC9_9RHOB|nr:GntR family transcriptional regulator [Paracoccus onchidii]MDB6177363.1 GntR family transcriptional regulator [Paracoccus onchidii]
MNIAEYLAPAGWFVRNGGPRYVQLRQRLVDGIEAGILTPNSSLPPERELAEITELSRVTVRRAIHDLVRDGLIEQRQGSGSFVRDRVGRVEQSLSHLTSFTEDMARRGVQTSSRWLERGMFQASTDEVEVLGLAPGDQVSRIYRLREADGKPLALERATLPLDILSNPTEITTSLYEVLAAAGRRPVRAIQKISAVNIAAREAELLRVQEGAAGLRIQRISYLSDGRIAELTRSLYRGDAYDFVAELNH